MARRKIWHAPQAVPSGVAPIYEWRTTDGAIRHGTNILTDLDADGEVLVNLKLTNGHAKMYRKRDVIATFAHGRCPRPTACKICGEPITFESVGRMDFNNWPAHVKWLPKNTHHGVTCLDRLMQELPIHGAIYARNIDAPRDPDPIGSHHGWMRVGPPGRQTRVRCGLGKKTLLIKEISF